MNRLYVRKKLHYWHISVISDLEKLIINNDYNWNTKRTHDYNFQSVVVTVCGLYKKVI